MCEDMKHILLDLIRKNESLSIIYLGGSQQGVLRDISPISISGEKLRAKCHSSGVIKTYNINKIQFPNDNLRHGIFYGDVANKSFETMQDVSDDFHTLYPDGKWDVEFSNRSFEVFDFFKNGKRKKSAFLAIYFIERDEEKMITEIEITFRNSCPSVMLSEQVLKRKTRPWVVGDPRNGGFKAYSTLHNAAIVFFEKLSLTASGMESK